MKVAVGGRVTVSVGVRLGPDCSRGVNVGSGVCVGGDGVSVSTDAGGAVTMGRGVDTVTGVGSTAAENIRFATG